MEEGYEHALFYTLSTPGEMAEQATDRGGRDLVRLEAA